LGRVDQPFPGELKPYFSLPTNLRKLNNNTKSHSHLEQIVLLFQIIQLPSYVCFDQLKLFHTNNNHLPHSNQQLIPLPLIQLRQIFLKFSSLLLSFIYCIYLRDH